MAWTTMLSTVFLSGKGAEGTMEGKEFRVRSFGKVNAYVCSCSRFKGSCFVSQTGVERGWESRYSKRVKMAASEDPATRSTWRKEVSWVR